MTLAQRRRLFALMEGGRVDEAHALARRHGLNERLALSEPRDYRASGGEPAERVLYVGEGSRWGETQLRKLLGGPGAGTQDRGGPRGS